MTDDQLKDIVAQLENRNEKDRAFFGFYQYGGATDESFIRANRKGLELFAAELLKVGLKSETLKFEKSHTETVGFNTDWVNQDADFFFDFIEVTNKDRVSMESTFPTVELTWKDKLLDFGVLLFGFSLVLITVIGIGTVLNLLF